MECTLDMNAREHLELPNGMMKRYIRTHYHYHFAVYFQVMLKESVHLAISIYGAICVFGAIASMMLPIETKGREMKVNRYTH